MTNLELAGNLRQLADWLTTCPEDMPVPAQVTIYAYTTPEDFPIERALRLPGKITKEPGQYNYHFTRAFGGVRFMLGYTRDQICERRVLRTYEVPEYVIKAHTAEEVEWICPPVVVKGG